jgi:hypothetical protein
MTEISGRRAGCGESRTSGSGEGARKHGRLADAVRHAPIPHIISSSLIQFAQYSGAGTCKAIGTAVRVEVTVNSRKKAA